MLGGLTDLLFGAPTDLSGMARETKDLYNRIALPDDVWKDISPEALMNENAEFELMREDPATRNMQMQALARMAGLSEQGLSDVDQAGFYNAQQMGNQMARSGREAAMLDAQRRGAGGSGMEFALREIANQGGAQRAQEAAMQQAAESAKQRAMYNQAFLQGSGQVRGQDFANQAANTNIINQFNQANTQSRNQANQYNVGNRNDAARYNQEGKINLNQQRFNNEMGKAGGIAGANSQIAQAGAAQDAARQGRINQLVGIGGMVGAGYIGRPDQQVSIQTGAPKRMALNYNDQDPTKAFA